MTLMFGEDAADLVRAAADQHGADLGVGHAAGRIGDAGAFGHVQQRLVIDQRSDFPLQHGLAPAWFLRLRRPCAGAGTPGTGLVVHRCAKPGR